MFCIPSACAMALSRFCCSRLSSSFRNSSRFLSNPFLIFSSFWAHYKWVLWDDLSVQCLLCWGIHSKVRARTFCSSCRTSSMSRSKSFRWRLVFTMDREKSFCSCRSSFRCMQPWAVEVQDVLSKKFVGKIWRANVDNIPVASTSIDSVGIGVSCSDIEEKSRSGEVSYSMSRRSLAARCSSWYFLSPEGKPLRFFTGLWPILLAIGCNKRRETGKVVRRPVEWYGRSLFGLASVSTSKLARVKLPTPNTHFPRIGHLPSIMSLIYCQWRSEESMSFSSQPDRVDLLAVAYQRHVHHIGHFDLAEDLVTAIQPCPKSSMGRNTSIVEIAQCGSSVNSSTITERFLWSAIEVIFISIVRLECPLLNSLIRSVQYAGLSYMSPTNGSCEQA